MFYDVGQYKRDPDHSQFLTFLSVRNVINNLFQWIVLVLKNEIK